jgi:hypothetical protein
MTEQEWLECTDPKSLLYHLGSKADKRRCILFVCACERRLWNEPDCEREKIKVTEHYADGKATAADVAAALQMTGLDDMDVAYVTTRVGRVPWAISESLDSAALVADAAMRDQALTEGSNVNSLEADLARKDAYDVEKRLQCDLLRDIFGNPFRLVPLDPSWFTPEVVALAQEIYDTRAFDLLPSLAHALDAGDCDDAEILNHCRAPGTHVRGCWMLDLVLGKG